MSPSKKKPKRAAVPTVKDSTQPQEQALFARVVDIIQASRQHVARSVNTAMVQAYWLIGRDIVEVEQQGKARAGYGDELIARLAKHLRGEVGKGFGARTLRRIRLFYLTYPEGSALPPELGGWRFGQHCCPNLSPAGFGQHRCPNRRRPLQRGFLRPSAGPTTSSS